MDGTTHCLNCGNEFMENYEFEFHLCTDCISDATCEFMSKSEFYQAWRELE